MLPVRQLVGLILLQSQFLSAVAFADDKVNEKSPVAEQRVAWVRWVARVDRR